MKRRIRRIKNSIYRRLQIKIMFSKFIFIVKCKYLSKPYGSKHNRMIIYLTYCNYSMVVYILYSIICNPVYKVIYLIYLNTNYEELFTVKFEINSSTIIIIRKEIIIKFWRVIDRMIFPKFAVNRTNFIN